VALLGALVSDELTPRQREIMGLIAEGLTNAQIADRLGVSERTVKNHLTDIRRKLGLRNRVQIAVWAVRHGLIRRPIEGLVAPPVHRPVRAVVRQPREYGLLTLVLAIALAVMVARLVWPR